jgi:hypothetical protein
MRKKLLVAAMASSALVFTAPLPASADTHNHNTAPRVTVVNTTVQAPFSLALHHGRVFVADGGTSTVSRLVGGSLKKIAQGPQPGDVAGLDVSRNGRYLAYTTSNESHSETTLEILGPRGSHVSADLAGYEAKANPDKKVSYGVDNPSKCVADALAKIPDGPPVHYKGQVDSHPYAVASVGDHWVVADAGGNDLLRVSRKGKVSTLAVLPRQPLKITAAIASGLGLPDCAIGVTYNFESVPTDVEVGRGGWLYVTTLAGGPEDPSFGARSKVYRVNPHNGHVTRIASGLAGATNLAIGRHGQIYVTELFAGRISVLKNGKPQTFVKLANALSVEAARDGSLWAGTIAPTNDQGTPTGAPGSIVHITGGGLCTS